MSPLRHRSIVLAGCILYFFLPHQSLLAQQWYLAWSDEFNSPKGTLPAPSTWQYDSPYAGAGNQEYETYCGQTGSGQTGSCANWMQNASQDGNGNLVISAISSGGLWTSARLITHGTFTFTYGRVEARLKLPVGMGVWPAFWMLGDNIFNNVNWPDCGEVDIMEDVPQFGVSKILSSLHGPGYSGGASLSGPYNFPGGQQVTDYHVYGAIWSKDQVSYYVDDPAHPFKTISASNVPAGGTWAFNDHAFFLLLNLAIGGGFPGPPDATTPSPANMLVDYVRVYQNAAVTTSKLTSVSAATYNTNGIASPGSIFTGFGTGWGSPGVGASSVPLPTILQDTQALLQDSTGNTFPMPLYFVYPTQIAYEIPNGAAMGPAIASVTSGGKVVASGTVMIAAVAPGLFTSNATGQGPAAAQVLTFSPSNAQTYTAASVYDATQKTFVAQPIDLGPAGTSVYLILFGTGIRNGKAVTASVSGVPVPVTFAGAQPQYEGEDQVNIGPLPQSLRGQGLVNVALTVDGIPLNTVQIAVK